MEKYAVVTGCSSGIGHATAIELAKRGYTVFAGSRRLEPMEDLREFGIVPFSLDVCDLESVINAREFVAKQTEGRIDILFNNAGQGCSKLAIDATDEDVLRCFQTNLIGSIRMTREFVPFVMKTKGCIAFTGSGAGFSGFPFNSIYSSTKAALHMYANTLHLELKPFGVRVLNIVTGAVKTDIGDKRPFPDESIYHCPEAVDCYKYCSELGNQRNPTAADVYARRVVDDMENLSNPATVFRGKGASAMSTVAVFFPTFIYEFVVMSICKMNSFIEAVKKKTDALRNSS